MVQHFLAHTAPRPFILTMSIRRPGVAITISLPPARILGIGDLCKDVKLVDERPVQSSAGGGIPEQRGPRMEQEIMLQYTCMYTYEISDAYMRVCMYAHGKGHMGLWSCRIHRGLIFGSRKPKQKTVDL